jgi:hypothetical protein
VHPDLVSGIHDHLRLLGEGLDRVAGNEPRGLEVVLVEELEQARRADLTGEQAAGDVGRRVLAAVGAEPPGHRVDVDPVRADDLLGHASSPRRRLARRRGWVRRRSQSMLLAAPMPALSDIGGE